MLFSSSTKKLRVPAVAITAIVLGMTAFHGDIDLGARRLSSTESDANASDPTFLADFNYRLSDVGPKEKVDELYSMLIDDIKRNEINNCYHRAHIWSYQMEKLHNIQSGKIFLFYGSGKDRDGNFSGAFGLNGTRWWFHVAPYVVSEGKEYVLEKIKDVTTPMLLNDWLLKHSMGKECKLLDGTETEAYSYLRKNFSIPMTVGGHPCYVRKTPMAYRFPTDVVAYDMDKAPVLTELGQNRVYGSCVATYNTLKIWARRKFCNAWLNDPIDKNGNNEPAPVTSPSSQ